MNRIHTPFHRLFTVCAVMLLTGSALFAGALWASSQAYAKEAAVAASKVGIIEAFQDLDELNSLMKKKKAKNDEIQTYLKLVGEHYGNLEGPAPLAKDADEDAKKKHKADMASFTKKDEKFRKDADKLFLKAVSISKVKGSINRRNDVNIDAANVLSSLAPKLNEKGRKSMSKSIRGLIDKTFKKAKYDLSTDVLNAAFNCLGAMKDIDTLAWFADGFTHSKEVEKEFLVGAHSAMRLFPVADVPGKMRYDICKAMIKTYAGVEAQAENSTADAATQAKKRFWDDIKTYTIPAVQHFSKNPVSAEDEEPIAKMGEFQKWWRAHKRPNDPVWKDPKKDSKKGKK